MSVPGTSLITTSLPTSFELGTGASIYTQSLLPAFHEATHEIILVTCFWARSATLTAVAETIQVLAERRRQLLESQAEAGPEGDALPVLRIRICFSSRSLFQKLFHTTSKDGYLYPPSSWSEKLGLPTQQTLRSGNIDLQVKSLFFLPFCVMHPKFLIIDRQRAWLPSCNVSWEPWLEGCISFTGDAVTGLVRFYEAVWARDNHLDQPPPPPPPPQAGPGHLGHTATNRSTSRLGLTAIQSPARLCVDLARRPLPTIILPSSHHRNPRFRPFPWQGAPSTPPTPLNCAILRLLDMAENSVYMQTPNLTSTAVLDALLDALLRGVNVTVVTSKNMMLIEQIVTAGTTTSLCVKSLIKRYQRHRDMGQPKNSWTDNQQPHHDIDLEAQRHRVGSLKISYYHPRQANMARNMKEEPVQSHLKLTIVDEQYTVLGSGNMDRASWFTSQELGVLFQSGELATTVANSVAEVLQGRADTLYSSE
ncbi:uncharacterized protein B0I36DRAFT_373360 [Microdochium trichocladiopsis]|uniref:PLD phosphodiesterase domain-containing protein n=1 Tax=Microdochium trichocladiopsis TaxID=1682393 RepID=A0A9P8Y7R0_9PEZI|nr:uncharacterized protein B0I36DRAFT_373360 [Microdochium trichocladiopsis]KAH7032719.1 hypothetical protein B0I36DRAFT_373360 [Microdochium trichocladiopsis]